MRRKLIGSGEAAAALGINARTLQRWWSEGMVEPEIVTAGGQARWDLEKLKEQLRARRRRDE